MRCTRKRTSAAFGTGAAASRISILPGAVMTACFTPLPHAFQPAPVDIVGRACAIARARRAQVHEQIGDFFRRSEPADRCIVLRDLVEMLLPGDVLALGEL